MKIKILFFGITTDLMKVSQLEILIEENTNIQDFKKIVLEKFPQLQHIHSYAIAVNETYATPTLVLKENDVVAIIPPVSGG